MGWSAYEILENMPDFNIWQWQRWRRRSYSRAECGTEAEADSFSAAEVLVFKTEKQLFPNILEKKYEQNKCDRERRRVGGRSSFFQAAQQGFEQIIEYRGYNLWACVVCTQHRQSGDVAYVISL